MWSIFTKVWRYGKFLWALAEMYPQMKKIWDTAVAQWKESQGAAAPSKDEFKKIVVDGVKKELSEKLYKSSDGTPVVSSDGSPVKSRS